MRHATLTDELKVYTLFGFSVRYSSFYGFYSCVTLPLKPRVETISQTELLVPVSYRLGH
jgi:hypothetical protein